MTSGTKLGLYEILAPIGAGGMGEVYRARDTKLKRDVAQKVCLREGRRAFSCRTQNCRLALMAESSWL
jgi:hypothetical protein